MRALFSIVLAFSLSAGAAPVFRNPVPVPIPTTAVSAMRSADFNGDGHPDVMLVNPAVDLTVFLSNGSGPFAAPVLTPISQATGEPGIGDLNRDGHVDVVVTDWSSQTAGVLFGNGDGSFRLGPTLTAGLAPSSAAVGDFNGDSFADVAVGAGSSTGGTNLLRVYLGNGTGSFSSAIASLEIRATSLVVADLNRDGKSDLLIDGWPSAVTAIANGDGTFTSKSSFNDGGIGVADFNHDGNPDIAVAVGGSQDGFVEVRLGAGDGTLGPASRHLVGYGGESIAIADVDMDGNSDLLTSGTMGSTVTLLRGNANGTFRPADYFLSGPSTWKVVAGDFDHDDTIDFVTVDYNSEIWALSCVRGNGDGTFQTYRAFHTSETVPVGWPGLASSGAVVADMNNDDHVDTVVIQENPSAFPFDLVVLPGDGTGRLGSPIFTATTRYEWSGLPRIAVGDVNRDGINDVVAVSQLGYEPSGETFLGDGTGRFAPAVPLSLTTYGEIALADFDGDSILDLLVAGAGNGYQTVLHPGNGDGSFGAGRNTVAWVSNLFVGDLTGDGRADFVSSNMAYLNDGAGNFTALRITSDEVRIAALDDFDADGKLDVLFTTYTGVQTRFGNGDGTFGAPIAFRIEPVPNYPLGGPVAVADVDRDGKLDVAFGSTVYLSNGNGTFRSGTRFRTHASSVTFADMDENGSPDLLVQNGSANDIAVLTTYTTADPTEASSIALSVSPDAPRHAQAVTLMASVIGDGLPVTGTVAFSVDGTPIGIITVDRDGKASISYSFTVGPHDVAATHVGDENYLPAAAARRLDVAKGLTTLSIVGSPNPQPKGRTVTVQVGFSADSFGGLSAEAAKITLRDGDTPLGLTLVNGRATISTLDVGTHLISADYPGSESYEASTASYTQTITSPIPNLSLSMSPSAPLAGEPVVLHVHAAGGETLTGTISFYDGLSLIAAVPISENAADAPFTPEAGGHVIYARYSGDDNWAPAERGFSFYAPLPWGAPGAFSASGSTGGVSVAWLRVSGAASYTLWRKSSLASGWEIASSYSGTTASAWLAGASDVSALFAVTATDGSGNVSPMSVPDLATSFSPKDYSPTLVRAQHFVDLRSMIQCVRAYAGLAPFAYTNVIQAGQPVRAIDMRELRVALVEARNLIGLPTIPFTDEVLTPQQSLVRAAHILELRAGAN